MSWSFFVLFCLILFCRSAICANSIETYWNILERILQWFTLVGVYRVAYHNPKAMALLCNNLLLAAMNLYYFNRYIHSFLIFFLLIIYSNGTVPYTHALSPHCWWCILEIFFSIFILIFTVVFNCNVQPFFAWIAFLRRSIPPDHFIVEHSYSLARSHIQICWTISFILFALIASICNFTNP